MPEVALRPKARADLDDIWDYTVEKWGYAQAEKYLRVLNQNFETLAENPELGRTYDEVYRGLRVYPSVGISFSTSRRRKESTSCAYFTNAWISRRIFSHSFRSRRKSRPRHPQG